MKNFYRLLIVVATITLIDFSTNAQNVGIGTVSPAQKLEIAGSTNTIRINGLKSSGSYYQSATLNSSILYVNNATGDLYALPNGTSGAVLSISSGGVPTWSQPTNGTVTQVTGNLPITVINSTTTPAISLIGIAGTLLYGTGTASAFAPAGTTGQILESAGSGVPTWVTGSGQFIQNQNSAQQTANFWISGNASIGTAPVTAQQLTIAISSGGTGVSVTASGNGIGVNATGSGGGTGVLGAATGNTSSGKGGYGVEGTASSGGTGLYGTSSGNNTQTSPLPIGGFGVFATGTSNSEAGVYGYLGSGAGTPSSTTPTAIGGVYASTNLNGVTNWALVANNTNSTTAPTSNGLLVFGTTNAVGTITLGENATTYMAGGVKANGTLQFDNITNTNTVTLNTGVTSTSYGLTLPVTQGSANSMLYNADGAGTLAFTGTGTSGQVLTLSSGVPTWVTPANGTVIGVGTTAPIYNIGTSTSPVIAIQGSSTGTDAGGVLYSTGSGTSAVFNSTGTMGEVLESNGAGAPTWVTPTAGTVTSVSANAPLTVTGGASSTPTLNLIGTSGALLYGTGTASAFTPAGTSGQILESTGSGVPTWVTGSGQFIQNQNSAQQTANFWISGNTGIGTAPVTAQQLTVAITSGGTGISVTASGNGIGLSATGSGGGTGVLGSATGNTSSFNGGYGVEGTASAGGTGVWAASSGETDGTPVLGGYGVFATGTYNSQAGVYAFLNGVSGSTPSPHGTTIPALGAVYAQTTSTSSTTTPNAWAIIANNSGSATPTNNGLLVFGTTSEIGTVTLGANSTSYFTTGGAKANGSLVFDNNTNTNQVTINTGVTSSSYGLTLPVTQGAANSVLYNADGAGTLAFTGTGTSGQVLTLSSGVPTWVTPANGTVTGVGTTAPIYNIGTSTSPVIAIQGSSTGLDAGGVLYSTGSGTSAVFNLTGTAGQVLVSGGTGAPTWGNANTALTTSNITNTGSGSSVVVGNGNKQVVGSSPVTLDVQGTSGGIFYGTGTGSSATFTSAGTSGQVLESSGVGVPTWVTPTNGTVTSVGANLPLTITGTSAAPVINLIGTAGALLYGTGTASAFAPAGTTGQILESAGSGVPTWVTGSGQFIQNQSSAQQTANFWISGNASIGIAPVSTQQLTVAAPSGGIAVAVSASGSGGIGVVATTTASSGGGIEGNNSGGGFGVYGNVSGNTSSFNGGYGVEGAASAGGTGVWAVSSGQNNGTPVLGGFGVFATGTYNSQAGVYAFLNGVSGGTPSPHGATISALGAVYAQTTSTSSTTNANAWAIIANNSGSATPTNNGLLVFGTTSEIGTVTLGANSTSYFTTGGAKSNGSLVFDNSTNTNQVTINTGVTSSSYALTLPIAQGVSGSLLYNTDGAGTLAFSAAGSNGQVLTANSSGVPTWVTPTATSTTAWQLTGNANTTAGTDFVGTTDGNDLVFKTNNSENMRIANSTGNIGINAPAPNSTLQVNGSMSLSVNLISVNYNAGSSDYVIEGDCSNNNIAVTLPDATTIKGRVYVIVRHDITFNSSNALIINTTSGQTIGQYSSGVISLGTDYQQEYVLSDGNNWIILSSSYN